MVFKNIQRGLGNSSAVECLPSCISIRLMFSILKHYTNGIIGVIGEANGKTSWLSVIYKVVSSWSEDV